MAKRSYIIKLGYKCLDIRGIKRLELQSARFSSPATDIPNINIPVLICC